MFRMTVFGAFIWIVMEIIYIAKEIIILDYSKVILNELKYIKLYYHLRLHW